MMLLNPKTEKLLNAFLKRPSSSLLLLGDEEYGSDEVLAMLEDKLLAAVDRHNRIVLVAEEGKGITVEQVREFKKSLISKVRSTHDVARVAVIKGVETASTEAQNALLKLVEEPVDKTVLLLQAQSKNLVLSTIQSRCQTIPLLPITESQANRYAEEHCIDKSQVGKAYLVSGGAARDFIAELNGGEGATAIANAKQFLGASVFDRLLQQKEYDKKPALMSLCHDLEKLAAAGLHAAHTSTRWEQLLHEVRTCKNLLERNVTTKLVFLRLCTHL